MSSKTIEKRFDAMKTAIAILISLVLSFALVAIVSDDPAEALQTFALGPLSNLRRMGNVIELTIPLTFAGVAVSIMYSANQFSMITQSTIYAGACIGSWFAIYVTLPKGLHSAFVILMAGIVGMVLAAITAIMKVKWQASEVVSSIMINYIIMQFTLWFLLNVYKDPTAGFNCSYKFKESARLTKIVTGTRIHTGLFVCIAAVIFGYIFLYKTKWGYAIRVVGQNQEFARYSGIAVASVMIYSQVIGGLIGGIGGGVEIMGLFQRYTWEAPPSYGNDGLMVGILAKYNPLFVPFAALFLAYIRTGADIMSRITDVPVEFVNILQGVVIMLVAAEMFLAKWKHKLIVKNAQKQEIAKEAAK